MVSTSAQLLGLSHPETDCLTFVVRDQSHARLLYGLLHRRKIIADWATPAFLEVSNGGERDVCPSREIFLTPIEPASRGTGLFWR